MQQARRAQWASRLAAWEASGQSQAAWCRAHGVSLASLGYWRRKLGGGTGSAAAVLPIQVARPALADTLEILLPNGIVLRAPASDPAVLLPWLRALCAC